MFLKKTNLSFLHDIFKDLRIVFVFNTVKEFSEGVTFYDLKQIADIPHSKIYRMMRKLEKKGCLNRSEEKNETGRPKFVYTISKEGENYIKNLKNKLKNIFEEIKNRFPEANGFDPNKLIDDGKFESFKGHIGYILQKNISDKKKLQKLIEIEEDELDFLQKLRNKIKKLKKKIEEDDKIDNKGEN